MAVRGNKRTAASPLSTRERIEREAISIFSDKGYEATSMREISEAAGVTKPVIYYYFQSKENLCHHLISAGLEQFRQQLQRACTWNEADKLEQIIRAVDVHFAFCRSNVAFVRFIYAVNFGPDRKKIDYDFYGYGMETRKMLTELLQRASESGVIQNGKEEDAAYYLRGIVTTFVMRYVDGRGELPPQLARTIVTDMVNGLGEHKPGSG